jgi:hypothetical protein
MELLTNRIISLTHLGDGKVVALCADGTLWVTNNISAMGRTTWMPVNLPVAKDE